MTEPRHWFRARRYGWGWGLPLTWEGWLVSALWLALLVGGAVVLLPAGRLGSWVVSLVVLNAGMLAICRRTGEPPRWRWGGNGGRDA